MKTIVSMSIALLYLLTACNKDSSPKVEEKTTYLSKETSINSSGSISAVRTYNYDDEGRLASVNVVYPATPANSHDVLYSDYDHNGISRRTDYRYPANPANDYYQIRIFNQNGKPVLLETYRTETDDFLTKTEYVYMANTVESRYYSSPSVPVYSREVAHTLVNGNISKIYQYNSAGELLNKTEYPAYDDVKPTALLPHLKTVPPRIISNYRALSAVSTQYNSSTGEVHAISEAVYEHEYNEDGYWTKTIGRNPATGATSTTEREYIKR